MGGEEVECPLMMLTPTTHVSLANPFGDMRVSVTSCKASAGAWSQS
jgi:hypothetical protein